MKESSSPTVRWFGKSWGAPLNADCPQCPVPVGQVCFSCDESIEEADSGIVYANGPAVHWECGMRIALGSVAHQMKLCPCHGYAPVVASVGLTKRQEALAAARFAGLREPR